MIDGGNLTTYPLLCIAAGYICDCNDGWTNEAGSPTGHCVVRECESGLACQNGGICVAAHGVTPDHCDCVPGFTGDLCQCT